MGRMIIAELGNAHLGNIGEAIHLIEAAHKAGADAVKLQDHTADPNSEPPPVDRCPHFHPTYCTRQDYWERVTFSRTQLEWLAGCVRGRGMKFGISPFSFVALEKVVDLCDFVKLARGQAELQSGCLYDKPVISSATKIDIDAKILKLDGYSSAYDGISDHSGTIWPSIKALAQGAEIVEVHLGWSRDQFHPDAKYSVTPDELKQICDFARGLC